MERSHQSLVRMCSRIDKANFARPEEYKKFQIFAIPIMEKVNKSPYRVSKLEAEFLLKYIAKQSLMYLGVGKPTDIEVYSKGKMNRRYGKGNGKALPDGFKGVMAAANPSESRIIYSEQLINDIASGDVDEMYRAFRTVLHETKHIEQSYKRIYGLDGYIMALETMAMHVDPFVYLNNYWGTYRECDAEKYGMESAQTEFPGLYRVIDKRNLRENWMYIKDGLTGNTQTIIGRVCSENGNILLPGSMYPAGERIKIMELIAEEYIKKYPQKAFKEYPVLQFAFKSNGKRKSISELLENMLSHVENAQSLNKAQAIESFYLDIIANRFPYDYERDSAEVFEFIRTHKMKNIFVGYLERTIDSLQGQDYKRMEIERDFMKYGVGMSRASRLRRRAYCRQGAKRLGVAYAAQYYIEPEDELREEPIIADRYRIDVPVIDNSGRSSQDVKNTKSQDESEEIR